MIPSRCNEIILFLIFINWSQINLSIYLTNIKTVYLILVLKLEKIAELLIFLNCGLIV
jgi:hypothetical protein